MINTAEENKKRLIKMRKQELDRENQILLCVNCNEHKKAKGNFRKSRERYNNICSTCFARERNKVQIKLLKEQGKVKCTDCEKELDVLLFPLNTRDILGVSRVCLDCSRRTREDMRMTESLIISIENRQNKKNRYN